MFFSSFLASFSLFSLVSFPLRLLGHLLVLFSFSREMLVVIANWAGCGAACLRFFCFFLINLLMIYVVPGVYVDYFRNSLYVNIFPLVLKVRAST